MIYALYGALGAVLVLLLFAGGIYAGYKLYAKKADYDAANRPTPEPLEEAERRRLIEDQRAFHQQMSYNADIAFGTSVGEDGDY